MQPEVIYEDNHLLIVSKPSGWETQPTLEEWAKAWIKQEKKKPGNVFCSATHRLDKVASGIVILAKTSKALSRMQRAFREKKVEKTYLALVEGEISLEEGEWIDQLVHDDFRAKVVKEGGKRAVLRYRVLQRKKGKTLLEIDLETGRYHQIRIQCSSRGHPIAGDKKYGSHTPFAEKGIALHHAKTEFPHPTRQEVIQVSAPLPESEVFPR